VRPLCLIDDVISDAELVKLLGQRFQVRGVFGVERDGDRAGGSPVGGFTCGVDEIRGLQSKGEVATDDDVVGERANGTT